jgi:hypothetical protein
MFSDTIAIEVDAVSRVLNRVNQDGYASEYFLRESDGTFRLKLRNTSYKDKTRNGIGVDRHNVELVYTIFPVAPATVPTIRKFYSVLENDQSDDIPSILTFAAGIVEFHTDANLTKLLNWES